MQKWALPILIVILNVAARCSKYVPADDATELKQRKEKEAVSQNVAAQDRTDVTSERHVNTLGTPKADISTISRLLSETNSEPQKTPITHVVIHFISNAAAKPQAPYDLEDILSLYISYGVSAHYMIGREGAI